ncbi:CinA family protein [Plastoroseomonas arctica]|uniref:CinA family protein n=1 Tax=Plastoroseomonas arctica TaxID=1509237 RepID=A0AAF1K5I0_9PROT|nr:CinA family protein [Plastoroseomonas arctica]MBR0656451.1 CinA family protein [Plastoroseomonas arctica]
MESLIPHATLLAQHLIRRGETIAVAESSTGGLVAAALLAVPGASAFMRGGGIIYTQHARSGLLGIELAQHPGMRASTEPYAVLLAQTVRMRLGADWGLGESGATGPTGNRYGDAAGHSCLAIAGATTHSTTIETGSADRVVNMRTFALALFDLALAALDQPLNRDAGAAR